jgi:hypothetical protein
MGVANAHDAAIITATTSGRASTAVASEIAIGVMITTAALFDTISVGIVASRNTRK